MSVCMKAQMPNRHGSGIPRMSLQVLVQRPQFSRSLSRLTHLPSQQVSPIKQPTHSPSHRPFLQALPGLHSLPHMPQFLASLWLSLHTEPQQTWPVLHEIPAGPHLH